MNVCCPLLLNNELRNNQGRLEPSEILKPKGMVMSFSWDSNQKPDNNQKIDW